MRIKLTWILLLLSSTTCAAQSTQLQRVAIVDDSGSMSGEKARTVRDELLDLARQLPPSPSHPFALVIFGTTSQPARVFTDIAGFQTAVAAIGGNSGGTSIASGILEAHQFIQQQKAPGDMLLLLFTDGADDDERATRKAESKLTKLFASRSQRGLSNSVYMKRWGNANAALAARLATDPNVKLLDSKELKLKSVTLEPSLKITEVKRLADPRQVKIVLIPLVDVRPSLSVDSLRLNLECVNPQAKGDVRVAIDPAQPPATLRIELALSDAQLAADRVQLEFVLKAESDQRDAGGSLVLAQLARRRITLPVSLPPMQLRNRVTAILDFHKPPRWSDPMRFRAVYPLKITFDVSADDKAENIDRSASFLVTAVGETTIVNGQQRFTLPGEGKFDVELELETSPLDPLIPLAKMKFAFALTIKPIRLAPNVRFDPPQLDIGRDDLPPPDPLLTPADVRVRSVGTPHWVRLPDLAMVDGVIDLDIRGPTAPQSRLQFSQPPGVTKIQFAPHAVQSGRQSIRFRMFLSLPPAPGRQEVALSPALSHATNLPVEFGPIAPVRLVLSGPKPLTLVTTDRRGQLQAMIRRSISDTATNVTVPICPVLAGPVTPTAMSDLEAQVFAAAGKPAAGPLPLYETTPITLSAAAPDDRSFFTDHQQVIPLTLSPSRKTPIIAPGSCQLVVTHRAPFKRLLFYLVTATAGLSTAYFLFRTFGKLTTKEV